MPQKRATYMTYDEDDNCAEIRKFIEEGGVILDVRDLKEKPLSEYELSLLLGHLPLTYFVNTASRSFEKAGWAKGLPKREEVIAQLAKDPTLLRRPIIKTTRLVLVGCNKEKVAQMLQLNSDGDQRHAAEVEHLRKSPRRAANANAK